MSEELYRIPKGVTTAWSSPENPTAAKGGGGTANRGAKGHAFEFLRPGQSVTLLNEAGGGVVQRIWITVEHRTPKALRSLRIDMYWDGLESPAVSVPLGDFFGVGLGLRTPFHNVLFADPEGRSFLCTIPMPFQTAARIEVVNEGEDVQKIFYDVNFLRLAFPPEDAAYFHAYWNRESRVELEREYEILPRVEGRGRFLGTNIGVVADPIYGDSWFGEGEVKMYLDGDGDLPSLVGTGTEDYIGTGWGQGAFANAYQGCLIADKARGLYVFYRYHIPDPIYFETDCRVTLQAIGGSTRDEVRELVENGAELIPVSVDPGPEFLPLFDQSEPLTLETDAFPNGWVNFWRRDDFSSTAYFYLSHPANKLGVPGLEARMANLPSG